MPKKNAPEVRKVPHTPDTVPSGDDRQRLVLAVALAIVTLAASATLVISGSATVAEAGAYSAPAWALVGYLARRALSPG